MKALRIKNWNAIYEKYHSRQLKETKWVPVPNTFDGRGYKRLVAHADGA